MDFITGTMLFYGGLMGLGITFIITLIVAFTQQSNKKKLEKKLNEAYGK